MTQDPHETRSVLEHITELRNKIFISLGALIVGAVIAHSFHKEIIRYILFPAGSQELIFLSPLEPLLFIFKIDFLAGLTCAFPLILWCIFSFIKPALSIKSRSIIFISCVTSAVLLVAGILYAYFVTLPLSLRFLFSIVIPGTQNNITAQSYLNFFFTQIIVIMLIFQIPIVLIGGFAANVFNVKSLASKRRYIYLVMILGLAILTPTTDIFSLAIVLIPTLGIFEISLFIGWMMQIRKKKLSSIK